MNIIVQKFGSKFFFYLTLQNVYVMFRTHI